jgi:uncharacterized membrane protein
LNKETEKKPFLVNPETVQLEKHAEKASSQVLLPEKQEPQNFQAFFKTNASSYIATLILATTSMTAIFVFQNQDIIVRNLSGLLLTLCLPGYALMKALFPPKTLRFENQGHMGLLFTGAFSVVMSIVVVAMVTFALDLTPIGVTLVSVNLSLFFLTLIFGTVGLCRRYSSTKNVA